MVVPIRHVSGSFRQRWPSEVFEAAFYGEILTSFGDRIWPTPCCSGGNGPLRFSSNA